MADVETKFSVMVSLFEWIQRSKQAAKKRSKLRKFLDTFCNPSDYFGPVRLLLPGLDRERGSYGLKESVLATSLVDALGMSRDSPDALRLFNWRKGGAATGSNAGHFALVAAEVLQLRQGMASGGLTIKELNELLDRLASSESRAEKTSVISSLIKKTNAQEMKWIIMIILKDLKLGISEKTIFHEFHPDAEDLFNVTCDLKLVCEKLRDRSKRHKRQDIEVGKAVRPQLANRVSDAHAAWKKLHGKEVVVECKFDGDRIQVHKNGAEVHYFSRNFLDHSEYGPAMSDIIMKNVLAERCILDGEMLVWDNSLNRFTEFGLNQEIDGISGSIEARLVYLSAAKAAKDGLDSHRQLCYVAFDVLYVGDTSVIHQSLKERQELLQKVVQPQKGRLEILVPKGGINSHRLPGEPCWSLIACDVNAVERFYKETIENRDEGIVIKDLGSKWEPGDRSGKWMKLKPDYVRAGSDLDVLIIGGYYGSGRRGGEVAQFLVALAERPAPNTYPRRFISFCRVGTGLSADDLDAVVTKLKPYFRRYEYPKKAPPTFYQVTNHSKERPDVWIESPEKSIILSITSDIRTIRSEVFAAPYGLRFPRIDKVRYDKPWYECLDVQSFVDLVHSSNGTTQKEKEQVHEGSKPTRSKSAKRGEKKNAFLVPSHLIQTDVSNVKGQSMIFSNMMFYFINVPPTHSLESLHKMVAENGGTFAMNLNGSVTHRIAAQSKGIKYQAAKLQGDVIHCSWVFDCISQKKLLPLQPKYFLFISNSSKKKLEEEIDEFSDSYYWNLDLADIRQLLNDLKLPSDVSVTDGVRKKYCPDEKWCRFSGCSVYFISIPSIEPEWDALPGITARRLKLEIVMGGGKVGHDLTESTTHVVVLTVPDSDIDFDFIRGSFTAAEKRLVHKKRLHLVRSQWIEDSLERGAKLPEDTYSLMPAELELILEDSGQDPEENKLLSGLDVEGDCKASSLIAGVTKETGGEATSGTSITSHARNRGAKRKKGPAVVPTKKGNLNASQAPRTWARIAKRPAKIYDDKSEESSSCDEKNKVGTRKTEDRRDIDRGVAAKHTGELGLSEHSGSLNRDQDLCEVRDVDLNIKQEKRQELLPGPSDIQTSEAGTRGDVPEKLEVMVDPVHAMLLDMIPSLGLRRTETAEAPKPRDDKRPAADPEPQPSKKKKVSYKDLAGELLKDW